MSDAIERWMVGHKGSVGSKVRTIVPTADWNKHAVGKRLGTPVRNGAWRRLVEVSLRRGRDGTAVQINSLLTVWARSAQALHPSWMTC